MGKVVLIGGGGKSHLMQIALAMMAQECKVVSPREYQGNVWETLAIDECPPLLYPKQHKAHKGKGQRKANRVNRWR